MDNTEDNFTTPLERAINKLADLRVAKREAQDKLFYETFDSIFVNPIKKERRETNAEDERIVAGMINSMVTYADSPEGSKELANQVYYLDHPEMDPAYYQKIVDEYCFGDVSGEMNEEYWNVYNINDPLEAHPKCMGDVSVLRGFDDTAIGREYKRREDELITEIQLCGGQV